ncbi:hypothetical protein K456DRAFT_32445 [Colletotrichum gloeosporioides 23]|nr:hypothetical protein K456DRAFT_32445 [Colletotrichum gloeosporioides 23]
MGAVASSSSGGIGLWLASGPGSWLTQREKWPTPADAETRRRAWQETGQKKRRFRGAVEGGKSGGGGSWLGCVCPRKPCPPDKATGVTGVPLQKGERGPPGKEENKCEACGRRWLRRSDALQESPAAIQVPVESCCNARSRCHWERPGTGWTALAESSSSGGAVAGAGAGAMNGGPPAPPAASNTRYYWASSKHTSRDGESTQLGGPRRGKANAPYAVKCRSLFPSVGGGDGLRLGSNKRVLVSSWSG